MDKIKSQDNNQPTTLLNTLTPGQSGVIVHVGGQAATRRRLLELGLVRGETIAQKNHSLPRIGRVDAVGIALHQLREGGEGFLGIDGRAFREVYAHQPVKAVVLATELGKAAHVQGVVHARMRRVLAFELDRCVDDLVAIAVAVIGIQQVQLRLLGLVAERIARLQGFEVLDRVGEIAAVHRLRATLVQLVGTRLQVAVILSQEAATEGQCEAQDQEAGAGARAGWVHRYQCCDRKMSERAL